MVAYFVLLFHSPSVSLSNLTGRDDRTRGRRNGALHLCLLRRLPCLPFAPLLLHTPSAWVQLLALTSMLVHLDARARQGTEGFPPLLKDFGPGGGVPHPIGPHGVPCHAAQPAAGGAPQHEKGVDAGLPRAARLHGPQEAHLCAHALCQRRGQQGLSASASPPCGSSLPRTAASSSARLLLR